MTCDHLDGDAIQRADVELENPGSVANPWKLFPYAHQLGEYRCQIVIDYLPEGGAEGEVFSATSLPFTMTKKKSTPSSGGHTGGTGGTSSGSKKNKTMMWAIPVALVVLAMFLGLSVMVIKYRRLQHSFLAFAARGNYTRQEDDLDDEDNMVVGFHAGIILCLMLRLI